MRFLLLPFFIFFLTVKNVESWLRIATEAFGAQVMILALIIINAGLAALLYRQIQVTKELRQASEKIEQNISTHQKFWEELDQEFPENETIKESLETLKNN